jgi:hypothetical protein
MALHLPTTTRPVQTQPRAAYALPGLRCGAPQRPDRVREHGAPTAAANLRQCRHNVANPMIESSRRSGHFDARWHTNSSRPPRTLVPGAEDDVRSIQNWENEGGRYATNNKTDAPAGLEWYAFASRYFPGRRRHDLEALKAYEAYRSATVAPSSVPRRPPEAADVIRRRAHRPSRSREVSAI